MATSVQDAVRKEKAIAPEEVWVDQDWLKSQAMKPVEGFREK